VKRRKVYLAMKKVTVLTACALSIGMAVGVASADVNVGGVMSGGSAGNDANGVSWQYLQDIDINGTNHNVFRLYADRAWMNAQNGFDNEILEVKGTSSDPSSAISNGLIFKDAFASANGPSSEAFNGLVPALRYTSYTTIGAETESADNVYLGNQGWALDGFNMDAGGTFASLPNGAGFSDNDAATMGAGSTLLMQITTTGDQVQYNLNINSRSATGGGASWVASGTVAIPAPGALALLGIAGLASRRRRRA
jgi:hypothetical protein